MAVWLIRAGAHGENEDLAFEKNLAIIGWEDLKDLSTIGSREELEELMKQVYTTSKPNTIKNWRGQLWAFIKRIEKGDLVILPLKKRSAIAVGRVTGPYKYRSDLPDNARHTRPVEWIKKDVPRSAFDQDILYSFGALSTVCQIQRNQAEQRVRAVIEGRKSEFKEAPDDDLQIPTNLEEVARDQLIKFLGQKFKGHDLTRLITALLKSQGYQTQSSVPGPDGGVDIIAGKGSMGFDAPKLCVQVKSSDEPQDVKILRELQGVMKNFGAMHGLLVSWGGFKQTVYAEARRLFFEIRLWDSGNVIEALLENYEKLPEDIQAELPLKRIWVLVQEE